MRKSMFGLILGFALVAFAGNPIAEFQHLPVLDGHYAPVYAQSSTPGESADGDDELFDSGKHKNIKTSFLLSLALPGAGEFYAGNKIKAGAFFAVEAALLTGAILKHNSGKQGEDDYRAFADEYWSFDYYFNDWFIYYVNRGNADIYTEQLPVNIVVEAGETTYVPNKTHDYYEMIGKYDWFLLGWEDLDPAGRDALRDLTRESDDVQWILTQIKNFRYTFPDSIASQKRFDYMTMRKETNEHFTWSKYFIGAAIFNHLVSAFDAAWTAKRANDRLYEGFVFSPSIEAQIALTPEGNPQPRLVINIAEF